MAIGILLYISRTRAIFVYIFVTIFKISEIVKLIGMFLVPLESSLEGNVHISGFIGFGTTA